MFRIFALTFMLFSGGFAHAASPSCASDFIRSANDASKIDHELREALGWFVRVKGPGIMPISVRFELEDILIDSRPILENPNSESFLPEMMRTILLKAREAQKTLAMFSAADVELRLMDRTISFGEFDAVAGTSIEALEHVLRGALAGRWHFEFDLDRFSLVNLGRKILGTQFYSPENQAIFEKYEALRKKLQPVAQVIPFRR